MRQEEFGKLESFIDSAKAKGASDEFLAALLARRGWSAADIYAALGGYWEAVTGVAIPERAGSAGSARDAFLYLLAFSTLATWSSALGSLIFEFINHWLPDPVARNFYYDPRSAITWQTAAIAVAFPIYVAVMRTILREAAAQPERLDSGVRKWLTYLALLGTAGAMICDLIWFLDYFLTGELTARFVLKAGTVMGICGGIFAYYLGSLRWNGSANLENANARSAKFGFGATVAVAACFATGMALAGAPSTQRQREADRTRVTDLRNLASAVKRWHDENPAGGLPAALADLRRPSPRLADPETNAPYEYIRHAATAYELCAVFAAEEPADGTRAWAGSNFWSHTQGRTCFTLDASKPIQY